MSSLIITHTDCLRHKTGAKTKTDSALGLLGSKILGTLITPLIEKLPGILTCPVTLHFNSN